MEVASRSGADGILCSKARFEPFFRSFSRASSATLCAWAYQSVMALDELASTSVGGCKIVRGTVLGYLSRLRAFTGAGSFIESASIFSLMLSKKKTTNGS